MTFHIECMHIIIFWLIWNSSWQACWCGLFQIVIEKGIRFSWYSSNQVYWEVMIFEKKKTTSCTACDNQHSVFSGIYEGERANVKNNFKIEEIGLHLVYKNEKQGYKLRVGSMSLKSYLFRSNQLSKYFEIDCNGILHVSTTEGYVTFLNKILVKKHLSSASIIWLLEF